MAASRQVDLLEPIDLSEHLDKIQLYLGQVCQIAGISKMQLDYWTNKAQIPTKGRKQRIYDMERLGADADADRHLGSQPRRCFLGRKPVHVEPGAELDPGQLGDPRHDLHVPVLAGMQPDVESDSPLVLV